MRPWAFVPVEVAVQSIAQRQLEDGAWQLVKARLEKIGATEVEIETNTSDHAMRGTIEIIGTGWVQQRQWRVTLHNARRSLRWHLKIRWTRQYYDAESCYGWNGHGVWRLH